MKSVIKTALGTSIGRVALGAGVRAVGKAIRKRTVRKKGGEATTFGGLKYKLTPKQVEQRRQIVEWQKAFEKKWEEEHK